ncbi:MAG: hypothetical protein PHX10_11645, partial [Gallionellaceae bacterium]|nr:hypothetical protein [Gallionellaceae bacterium]
MNTLPIRLPIATVSSRRLFVHQRLGLTSRAARFAAGVFAGLCPIAPTDPSMTSSLQGTLGIDFGTSNSAVSWAEPQGLSRLIALEGEALAMPTAVFFNAEDHRTHFGRDAVRQYLNGSEGRLMRSLKSLLGSPLLQEKTEVNHQQISFQDIVATFLAELRQRAARALGSAPTRVVMGRPVHFVDDNPQRDA